MCLNCAPCHRDIQGMRSAERNTSLPIQRPVDIVVRRLAAPVGREPVNWSDNLPIRLQIRVPPHVTRASSRGLARGYTRSGQPPEEVKWSNRTCDAAGGSRAYVGSGRKVSR